MRQYTQCLRSSSCVALEDVHSFQVLRNLNIPSQFLLHQIAQLAGGNGFAVNQICRGRMIAECAQPLQQFRRVGVIAELLERCDLGSNGNVVTKNLDLLSSALDCKSARAGGLKSNKQDEISGIGQALGEVMQNASAGSHAAG